MGLFSKSRTKRIVPPERKFANAMMVREATRRLAGEETPGMRLRRQQQRGRLLEDTEIQRRGLLRGMGEMGIDSPGRALAAARTGEAGLGSLIAAENEAAIQNREGAIPILGTLLRENQPYTQTREKKGFMAKAQPYAKLAGGVAGTIFGGPAGGAVGSQVAGSMTQDQPSGPSTSFGGTGGGTSGGPPTASVQSDPPVSAGGPPSASVQTDSQIQAAKKKKGMLSNIGGLSNLLQSSLSMFGG